MAKSGTAVKWGVGKQNKKRVYVEFKNGSVYYYAKPLKQKEIESLLSKLESGFTSCNLRYWKKAR